MDYAAYLREKYGIDSEAETASGRPSTAGASSFSRESALYTGCVAPRRTSCPPAAPPAHTAARLSRNRAARRAATDQVTQAHLATLFHMNRRIQEMYRKPSVGRDSGRRSTSRAGEGDIGGGSGSWHARPPTAGALQQTGPPRSVRSNRPNMPQQCEQQQRVATVPEGQWNVGAGMSSRLVSAVPLGGGPSTGGLAAAAGERQPSGGEGATFSARRVKNTAQALKTAILNEVIENRVYEEARLRQLFRSYLKLNSGEAFYLSLCEVVEELRGELGVAA